MRANHASALSSPKAQICRTGIPKISLTMYPFSISIDEHVPLKVPVTKRLSKIPKTTEFLIEPLEIWNYKGRLRFYV